MFKSLKNKLKSWITRTKEEVEEELVETPEEKVKEAKKEKPKEKKKKSKREEKEREKEEPEKKNKKRDKEGKKSKKEKREEVKEGKKEKEPKEELEKKPKEEKEEELIPPEPEEEVEEELKEEAKKNEEKPKEDKRGFFSKLFGLKEEKKEEESKEELKEITDEELLEIEKEEEVKSEEEEIEGPEEKPKEEEIIPPEPEKEVEEKKEEKPKEKPKEKPEEKPKKHGFSFFKRKELTEEKFDELFDELELILMQNNVAYSSIKQIKKSLKEKLVGESAKTDIETALKESIEELLINPPNLIEQIKEKKEKPFVILFAGINGAGKTTTIAKVAHLLKKSNFSVCLASADTFRAAAIEQLQVHADRLEVPLIKKDYGADPASVGFDAIKYAKKNKVDVVLIDTAGRMNNRSTLMKEIEKISRVNSPDLKIFLGESITGNDATEQAKDFNEAIGIDGIILSKADVDEKGGTAISVTEVTKKPIYYLGTGQKYEDLEIFNKEKLIDKIFSEDDK